MARGLRSVPLATTEARPEFRDALRERLLVRARVEAVARKNGRRGFAGRRFLADLRAERGLALTTAVLTVVVAVAGLWAGADRALPGEPLYGLKRHAEQVHLALTGSVQERGREHLAFADRRLAEVSGLLQRYTGRGGHGVIGEVNAGRPNGRVAGLITGTLRAMDRQTSAGAKALRTAYRHDGTTTPLTYLDRFARTQQRDLVGVLPELPTTARPQARHSLDLVRRLGRQASVALEHSCQRSACAAHGTAGSPPPGREPTAAATRTPTPTPSADRYAEVSTPRATASIEATGTPSTRRADEPRGSSPPDATYAPCEIGLCASDGPGGTAPEPGKHDRRSGPTVPGVEVSIGSDGIGVDVDTCRLLKACWQDRG